MPRVVAKSHAPRSLTTALAIAFAFMSTASLLIAGTIGVYVLFQTERDAIAGRQRVVAHQAGNAVAGFVQDKLDVMEASVRLSRPGEERTRAIEALLGLEPAFRQVLLLNAQNEALYRVSRMSEAESKRLDGQLPRDLLARVEDGRRYVGPVYVDQATSEPLVVMAVPTTDILGDVLGVLVTQVNLKFMWDLVDGLRVGDTGYAYVVDREGRLIAFGDTGRVLRGEALAHLHDVSAFMVNGVSASTAGASISTGIRGDTIVGTYVPLGTPDWAVMTELPIGEAYRRVVRSALLSATLTLLMALAAGLMGVFVARRLAESILSLTDTATRIADGETGLKAATEGPKEVASLARAFNNMTSRLHVMLDTEEERARELKHEVEQRKRTEEALTESEAVLKATLESSQDGVLVVGAHGRVSHHNAKFGQMWSMPDDLLEGADDRLLVEHVLPQLVDPVHFTARVKEVYRGSGTSEDTLHLKDGRVLERHSWPLLREGAQSGRAWFFRDITERKLARDALERHRKLLDDSQRIARIGSWAIDIDTRALEWTDESFRVLGERPRSFEPSLDRFIGRVHPDDRTRVLDRLLETRRTRPFESLEFRAQWPDDTVRWISCTGEVVADASTGTVRTVGTMQDINDRKRAEEELRSLRNYLSNIIDSMPSVLVGVDDAHRVTQWNKTVERITGIAASDAHGRPLADILPWMATEMGRVAESIRSRQVIQERKRQRSLDDETRYEDMTIYPLVTNGVEGAVIRIDDVTEKVRLEEMMIQSEKMLSVGGLAAGMAHEINNPLAGIMQTAEVMAHRLADRLRTPANQRAAAAAGTTVEAIDAFMNARGIPRMIAAITASGRRVADIVDNMLSFARKSDASVSSHRLEDLLDRTLELAATDYDLKKHYDFKMTAIVKEYADHLPAVPCEPAKIQQVLLNILRNGAQAMQEGGVKEPRFTLRTRFESERAMACIEIEDNGPGMDEETRKRVFEPFFTTKPPGVGTGLGLSVSYFIIAETHHGEMSVQSRPGSGATFIVRLPVEGGIG